VDGLAVVRERVGRAERDIVDLASELDAVEVAIRSDIGLDIADLRTDMREVRDDVRSMYRAFVTASISFVLAAAGIIATLIELFHNQPHRP
jgi:hypothetical protein